MVSNKFITINTGDDDDVLQFAGGNDGIKLADRLRDSAEMIRQQVGGDDGDAIFQDLDMLADDVENLENDPMQNMVGASGMGWVRGPTNVNGFRDNPTTKASLGQLTTILDDMDDEEDSTEFEDDEE